MTSRIVTHWDTEIHKLKKVICRPSLILRAITLGKAFLQKQLISTKANVPTLPHGLPISTGGWIQALPLVCRVMLCQDGHDRPDLHPPLSTCWHPVLEVCFPLNLLDWLPM